MVPENGGGDTWWYFLIFFGCLLVIGALVAFLEKTFGSDQILELKPLIVLRNIAITQVCFYASYLLILFSVGLLATEKFWIQQVFTSGTFTFYTRQGIVSFFSLVLALASLALPLAATTKSSRNMPDYVFTTFFIHFVVVSAAGTGFPASGAWWAACGVGFIVGWFTSEFLSHRLELMSYESSLGGGHDSDVESVHDVVTPAAATAAVGSSSSHNKRRATALDDVRVDIDDDRHRKRSMLNPDGRKYKRSHSMKDIKQKDSSVKSPGRHHLARTLSPHTTSHARGEQLISSPSSHAHRVHSHHHLRKSNSMHEFRK